MTPGDAQAAAELAAALIAMTEVLGEVAEERYRQEAKWGQQNHPDGTGPGPMWPGVFRPRPMADLAQIVKAQVDYDAASSRSTYAGILLEEVFEALCEDDQARLRVELVQVAAVAAAWVQKIDRDQGASA